MGAIDNTTDGRLLGGGATGGELADQGPTLVESYTDVTNAGESNSTFAELQAEADRRNKNDGNRDELTFAAYPQILKDKPNWVCWKWGVRTNKKDGTHELTKIPYEPNSMRKAKAGVPSTWGTYDMAVRKWLEQDMGGIGYQFADERDVTGVDFDHILVDGMIVDDELATIIEGCGTYMELSPSGDGLHMLSLCGKPEGKTRCKRGGYEMYDHAHFFTVTGAVYGCHLDIDAVPDVLERIYDKYLGADSTQPTQGGNADARQGAFADVDPGEGRSNDPNVIYEKLLTTNNAKLQALLGGDISGYPSHSEADLAMCNFIIFYAGDDAILIDAVFRMTPLYRPEKWDRPDSGSTHGMRTIGRATSNYNGDYYCWSRKPLDWDSGISPEGSAQLPGKKEPFALPDVIAEGDEKNTLFRYSCHLRAKGYYAEDILVAALDANSARCEKPLPESDVSGIVRRSTKYQRGGRSFTDAEKDWSAGMSWQSTYFDPETNRFMHERLAEDIVREAHASLIDGSPAIFAGGLWRFGYGAMERLCSDVQPRLTSNQRNEVIKDINLRPHVTSPEDFDGKCYIAFANGILCVESGEFVEPQPEMYVMGLIAIDFDSNAPEGLADEFLDAVTDGDAEARLVLEEFVGQAMCARQVIRQSLMLTGDIADDKRNASTGKSTFLGFVTALLGDGNVSSLKPSILGDRFQAVQLVGKLANIAADIPADELSGKALAMFKCMVTGDMIYTDVKNKQGFGFRSHATLAFAMNIVPHFADTTDGVWRRLCFIPFTHRFSPGTEGYDPNMDKKLARPENLQRLALLGVNALRGAIERAEDTYLHCEAGELVKQRVITENDTVLMWLYVERMNVIGYRPAYCYSSYREWCRRIGIEPMTINQFTRKVNTHCKTKTQPGSDGHRIFVLKT